MVARGGEASQELRSGGKGRGRNVHAQGPTPADSETSLASVWETHVSQCG